MTKSELAAELYELVVNKGRWGGKKNVRTFGENYESLPPRMQEMWDSEALAFSEQYGFELSD